MSISFAKGTEKQKDLSLINLLNISHISRHLKDLILINTRESEQLTGLVLDIGECFKYFLHLQMILTFERFNSEECLEYF